MGFDVFNDSCDGCGDVFSGATALAGRVVADERLLCPLCIQKDDVRARKSRERHRLKQLKARTNEHRRRRPRRGVDVADNPLYHLAGFMLARSERRAIIEELREIRFGTQAKAQSLREAMAGNGIRSPSKDAKLTQLVDRTAICTAMLA